MKKMNLILISTLTLSSCSSIEKSLIYSGLTGAILGGVVGKYVSPDKESDKFNIGVGASAGAVMGAALGAYFFNLDPDNKTFKMMNEKDGAPPLENFNIGVPLSEKLYRITPDTSNLPNHLKNRAKKQIIIEKVMPEKIIKGENGKTTVIPESKIIEYDYE